VIHIALFLNDKTLAIAEL